MCNWILCRFWCEVCLAEAPLRLVDNKCIFQSSLYLSINELRRKKAEKWWMEDKNAKVLYINRLLLNAF